MNGENVMIRIYSKDMKDGNKTRIRMKHKECSDKTLEKAMKDSEILKTCRVLCLPMYKGI